MPRQKKLENTTFGNQVTRLLAPAKSYERIERLPGTNLPDCFYNVERAQNERSGAISEKIISTKMLIETLQTKLAELKKEKAQVTNLMQELDAAEYRKAFKDELRHQGDNKMSFDGKDLNAADGYVFSNLDAHAACGYNDCDFIKERNERNDIAFNKRYTEEYLDLIHTARSVTVCCKDDCDVCQW
ncbi:MAG: hypothetical protein ISR34_09350 [Pirellulales bacterium]|nr:hypothetical protein [Pirellulales bacterium]